MDAQPNGIIKPPLVVFSTPTLARQFSIEYLMSALATQHLCYVSGINQVWRSIGGDPYLAKVRNRMASDFLRFPEATDLFFLDDDMGWPAGKVVEFIRRPQEVVVGAYPKKKDPLEFPIELVMRDGEVEMRDNLYLTNLAPTGFMRIKRSVIERIAAESGRYIETDEQLGDIECFDMFRMGYVDSADQPGRGKWWGEDFFFSARWRSMGGEIWCDPDIQFTHRGTNVWAAIYRDFLYERGVLRAGSGRITGFSPAPSCPQGGLEGVA